MFIIKMDNLISNKMQQFTHLLQGKNHFKFKQHQYDGVEWCLKNELRSNTTIHGGFIADEMGLGKTIMMIGTMFSNFVKRTLIVVPPSLIQQWYREIFKATGHKALLYYGVDKKQIDLSRLSEARIVITTYHALIPKQSLVQMLVWGRVIFDEAHHLRNSKTSCFINATKIKARIRWLVSGTPVQNKRKDFYNLCNVIGIHFNRTKTDKQLQELQAIIQSQFMLRRTKEQIGIQLPPINIIKQQIQWSNSLEYGLSKKLHTFIKGLTKRHMKANIILCKRMEPKENENEEKDENEENEEKGKNQNIGNTNSFALMLRARQCCILPNLMRDIIEYNIKQGILTQDYLLALNYSSKVDALIALMLERKHNGKGKIVFCHFRNEIDIISNRLETGGMKKVIRYDGRNSGGKQLSRIAEPADALIIQIQTGCEGLNLQEHFSEVYFVSPNWNPCVEDQAIARCHRIGQSKQVDIFKFEMDGFLNIDTINKPEQTEDKTITMDNYISYTQDCKRKIIKEIIEK